MIKVYVTGFDRPYGITGELVRENEQFLIVTENGVNKRIGQDRIIYVEEFDSPAMVTAEVKPPEQPKPFVPVTSSAGPKQHGPVPPAKGNPMKEALERVMKKRKAEVPTHVAPERASQVDPIEEPAYDPNDKMMVEVNFNGAKTARFDISVPKGVMGNKYTPALGREVFSHMEIKKVLADGSSILDGIPVVKENKVFYTTKAVAKTERTPTDKMEMVGQLVNAGSQLMGMKNNSGKEMPSGFSPITKTEFSMPTSPFESIPSLSIEEDDGDNS